MNDPFGDLRKKKEEAEAKENEIWEKEKTERAKYDSVIETALEQLKDALYSSEKTYVRSSVGWSIIYNYGYQEYDKEFKEWFDITECCVRVSLEFDQNHNAHNFHCTLYYKLKGDSLEKIPSLMIRSTGLTLEALIEALRKLYE